MENKDIKTMFDVFGTGLVVGVTFAIYYIIKELLG